MTDLVTGETKVGALLDLHPELEAVLVDLSPEFRRLSNPILRRTVARVATVAQAARIARLPVPRLVNALRHALGQPVTPEEGDAGAAATNAEPDWLATPPLTRLDADEILARGGTPVAELSAQLHAATPGHVVVLVAPFYPAPLVDAMREKGYDVHVRHAHDDPERWEVFCRRGR